MEKIAVSLELTEKQAGYLMAAVIELHHKFCSAGMLDYLQEESQAKIKDVKEIWLELEKQTGIA
jgi:hypothetical protein